MGTREKIERMKKWCLDNYENGADTMVECWGDVAYLDLLSDTKGDLEKAMKILSNVAEVYADRWADAVNSGSWG